MYFERLFSLSSFLRLTADDAGGSAARGPILDDGTLAAVRGGQAEVSGRRETADATALPAACRAARRPTRGVEAGDAIATHRDRGVWCGRTR